MVEKVSASTQNQAFSALLLLFREVLRVDLEEMSQTVRAKRGPKLPTVSSPINLLLIAPELQDAGVALPHQVGCEGTGQACFDHSAMSQGRVCSSSDHALDTGTDWTST